MGDPYYDTLLWVMIIVIIISMVQFHDTKIRIITMENDIAGINGYQLPISMQLFNVHIMIICPHKSLLIAKRYSENIFCSSLIASAGTIL